MYGDQRVATLAFILLRFDAPIPRILPKTAPADSNPAAEITNGFGMKRTRPGRWHCSYSWGAAQQKTIGRSRGIIRWSLFSARRGQIAEGFSRVLRPTACGG